MVLPKWSTHRKYALRFIREKYRIRENQSYWNNLINEINLLIDFPEKYFSEKDFEQIKSKVYSNTQRKCMDAIYLLISLKRMGFKVTGVTHDWRGTRRNRSLLVKQAAYCIYGEIGAKLVDLHLALDRIEREKYNRYEDFLSWASTNEIDEEVLHFIKAYWEEIRDDILREKRIGRKRGYRSVQRDYFRLWL